MNRTCILAVTLSLASIPAFAQGSGKSLDPALCGSPPSVTDEIQKYKGELDAGAKVLSRLIIQGAAKGDVEIQRSSVFAKMGNGGATAQSNYYLQYQVCLAVITDPNLATDRKVQLLIETRKAFQ